MRSSRSRYSFFNEELPPSSSEFDGTDTFTSPDAMLKTPNVFDASTPWGAVVEQAKEREDRRRRVAKLQRFLGERIPAELVGPTVQRPQTAPAKSPGRFGSALRNASVRFGNMRKPSARRAATDTSDEDEPWREPKPQVLSPAARTDSGTVIAGLRKARKLEQARASWEAR